MSVGVGVGLVMLAREGLSFASLQRMEEAEESQENVLSSRRKKKPSRGARGRQGRLTAFGGPESLGKRLEQLPGDVRVLGHERTEAPDR